LTERNAVQDFENQKRIILGGPRPATTRLKEIYSVAFKKIHFVKTGSKHAEMVKYITNCYLANKVSFANEMYQLAQALDLDYDKVLEYSLHDERLGTSHWAVKGPDGYCGFGGHCLPKDLNALIKVAEDAGIDPLMMKATKAKNDEVREVRDWEQMKGRAIV
jgi:UDPglucose 6-dehydrogenase